jgi:hypothetical protein
MGSAIRIGAVFFSLVTVTHAGLDLTPRVEEYELDGVKRSQLVFTDGERHITYAPPRNWEYSGGGNRLVLHPRSASNVEASITVSKLPRPEVLDEATLKRLCDEALASVPRGATNVALVSQQLSPLLIDRKETFLIVINYDYYSLPYAKSVMFLNRQNDQVRFELTCNRNTFGELQKAFMSSHYSWQNL